MSKQTALQVLIDDYKRRLETVKNEIAIVPKINQDTDTYKRLVINGAMYISFISELTHSLEQEKINIIEFHIGCVKEGTLFENPSGKFTKNDKLLVEKQAEQYFNQTYNK